MGVGTQPGTLRCQGSNCPAHTSRLCSRSLPEVSARLGPPRAWATPMPPAAPGPSSPARWLMEAHAGHTGAHLHQLPGPPKSKVLRNVLPAPQPPPRHPRTQAPGQAGRQEARRTVGQSRPKARGRHQPSRPPHKPTALWGHAARARRRESRLQRPVRASAVSSPSCSCGFGGRAPGHGAAAGRAVPARRTEEPLCLADWTECPVCLPPAASEDPALCPQLGTCLARRRLAPSERPGPCPGSVNAGPHDRSRRSRGYCQRSGGRPIVTRSPLSITPQRPER